MSKVYAKEENNLKQNVHIPITLSTLTAVLIFGDEFPILMILAHTSGSYSEY